MLVFFIPAGILAMLLVFHLVFSAFWDKGLSANAFFDGNRIRAGEKTSLLLRFENDKRMPLPVLILEFKVRRGLHFSENENITVSDRINVIEYFSVGSQEEITRQSEILCEARGVYRIEELLVTVPEIFSRNARLMKIPSDAQLTVLPRMLQKGAVSGINELVLGEALSKKRLYEDVFTFRGIREYTARDPLSRVNWKASARTGELMVNERDYTFGQEVCFLLNVESPGIRYNGDLLEDGISIAFDAAAGCLASRIPVSMLTNGRDFATGKELFLPAGSSGGHLAAAGDILARIDLERPVREFSDIIKEMNRESGEVSISYVLISSAMGDALIREAAEFAGRRGGLIWICPQSPGQETKAIPEIITFRRVEL
ncbi:MAG: DUF58 domain-containing protein [Lachnospiraceae bacterium]|nr:DUF58 domain-containing protein [Lachnospiraceae bacterium]